MIEMTRETIEKHQAGFYLAAIVVGLMLGMAAPDLGGAFETMLWPSLGVLLYVTFTQVPLNHLPEAFRDRRFMAAILMSNFVLVPLLVWGPMPIVSDQPAVKLGVLLVLLVPCTDWFITFTHLATEAASYAQGDSLTAAPMRHMLSTALALSAAMHGPGRSSSCAQQAGLAEPVGHTIMLERQRTNLGMRRREVDRLTRRGVGWRGSDGDGVDDPGRLSADAEPGQRLCRPDIS